MIPRFGDDCVTRLIPALLDPRARPFAALPDGIADVSAVVLLVVDGLGWNQLGQRPRVAPVLSEMEGGPVTTVAPSTTVTALTSIVTGTAPGEHGLVGYRIDVGGQVLNALRWSTTRGDARSVIVPEEFQQVQPFLGQRPVVVQNAMFAGSGFTRAHLQGVRHSGWRTFPTLAVEVRRALAAGEPFVYVYYDGIDRIAHEFGFGEHYDAELAGVDRLVTELMMSLPRGAALVVTADHGLVDCSTGKVELEDAVKRLVDRQSGEARFRWLHAEPGRSRELLKAAMASHGHQAWVWSAEQLIDEGWLGPVVTDVARSRLGDVALVARGINWFLDPADGGRITLIGRHGSLTADEVLVPMLSFVS